MISPTLPGEIIHAGKIIEPAVAQRLGDTVLGIFKDYLALPTTPYTESSGLLIERSDSVESTYNTSKGGNVILLGTNDQAIVDGGANVFSNILKEREVTEELEIDVEFFVGTAGGGDWHFDGQNEYRLLVNLSRTPLGLLIAKVWNEEDYEDFFGEDRFRKEGPKDNARIGRINYNSGEGVLLDNMREAQLQIPHAGVPAEGKVFIRYYASPVEK